MPIVLIIGLTLFIRIILPWDVIVEKDMIKIAPDDAPLHMRLAEHTVHNFPTRIFFDPFTFYPDGGVFFLPPLFTWIIASISFIANWFLGDGGIPSRYTIELIGALLPAIGGVLTVLIAYFISKEIFENRKVAILSALILATIPGQFLQRTMLGFADHHVLEILFFSLTMLFYIKALKISEGLMLEDVLPKNWKRTKKPILFSVIAGLMLGLYFLSWMGALFILAPFLLFIFTQNIINHLRNRSNEGVTIISIITFLIPIFFLLPFGLIKHLRPIVFGTTILPIILGIIATFCLYYLSSYLKTKDYPPILYPRLLILTVLLVIVSIWAMFLRLPGLLPGFIHGAIGTLFPPELSRTIAEAGSMFFRQGFFTLQPIWLNFTSTFYVAIIGLILLIIKVFKKFSYSLLFLIVWSSFLLLAMASQIRFAYYFAMNVAILSAFIGIALLDKSEYYINTLFTNLSSNIRYHRLHIILKMSVLVIIVLILIYPNTRLSIATSKQGMGIHPDWYSALIWLRDNTPSPTLDYNKIYKAPLKGDRYDYPPGTYSVMSWWDFGYAIVYYSKRIPVSTPGQTGIGGPPLIKYVDLNNNGTFEVNEPVIYDRNKNGKYDNLDTVIFNSKPPKDAILLNFPPEYMFHDNDKNGYFSKKDSIIRDKDGDFKYSIDDEIIIGKIPKLGRWLKMMHLDPGSATFFTAGDLETADRIIKYFDTKYIITSLSMASSKFWAIATWATGSTNKFYENYYKEVLTDMGVEFQPKRYYYPEFYQSMIIRLHYFNGEKVIPQNSTYVISYVIALDGKIPIRIITGEWLFSTYEEAKEFIANQKEGNYRIVGISPNQSPVPLEKLENYRPVYNSQNSIFRFIKDEADLRGIRIFEYKKTE
ncbi:MAG: hypothetical protein DDT23_01281 [candidate division WS2 bacterium]|nr:hypothetical protein [Candidatus Lithacetigena glycinireducens]